MSKLCPTCHASLNEESKKTSAWVPLLTAVGVSAAALIVYKQVKRATSPEKRVEDALSTCSRAVRALECRIGPDEVRLAS